MKLLSVLAGAVGALALASPCLAAPLETYGHLPFLEEASISPDGKLVALVVTDGENRKVVIRSLDDGKILTGVRAEAQKIRDIRWAGNNTVLITSTTTASIEDLLGSHGEHAMTKAFDISTGKLRGVLDKVKGVSLNVSLGAPDVRVINGAPIVLVQGIQFVGNSGHQALFAFNPANDTVQNVETAEGTVGDFFVNEKGVVVAEGAYEARFGQWSIMVRPPSGHGWNTIAKGVNLEGGPVILGYGRTPGTLLVSLDGVDDAVIREMSIADGKWGETLSSAKFRGIMRDRQGKIIGGTAEAGDVTNYTFFDPVDQARWQAILKAYPGQRVAFHGWSDDHQRVLVEVESPTDGEAFAWVDLTAKQAKWIGGVYQNLTPKDISPVRPISYAAGDGQQISGYLTLPQGKEARNLPLVVLPHGGPAAHDTYGFDWWAQALASRGYAVLQPNFRGSTGYGGKFLEAGFGEWGKKMQTDLSDGVRYLAAEGTIDPKRVCIAGASYGGYAALAGATLDKGVYRCAVSVAGPADLSKMIAYSRDTGGEGALRYWKRFMGVDGVRDPNLAAISPASLAASVDIPIMLIHGKDDTVVPYEQSRIMADALRKAGKPVEFVTLDGEDHWLSRGETRLKMLQSLTAFIETNNPPG